MRVVEQTWWYHLSSTKKSVVTVLGAAVGSFVLAWIGLQTVSLIKADMNRTRHSNPAASAPAAPEDQPKPHLTTPKKPAAPLNPSQKLEVPKLDTPIVNVPKPAESIESQVTTPSKDSVKARSSATQEGNTNVPVQSSVKARSDTTSSKTPTSATAAPKAATSASASSSKKKAPKAVDVTVRKESAPAPSLPGSGLW